jgi:PD-(D/E)XK endonuclease
MLALKDAGYELLVPFGENTRYDLVIDDGKGLCRVQCKTGRLRSGAIRFATCSAYGHHRKPTTARRSYLGQIDAFAIHCPETGGVYLVSIEDLAVEVQGLSVSTHRRTIKSGTSDSPLTTKLHAFMHAAHKPPRPSEESV